MRDIREMREVRNGKSRIPLEGLVGSPNGRRSGNVSVGSIASKEVEEVKIGPGLDLAPL